MAVWAPFAGVLCRRRLPLAGRDPDGLRAAARATPTSRRCCGWRPTSSRPTGSCPATARRSTAARAWRSCARTSSTWSRWRRRRRRPLPLARRDRVQKKIHAENAARRERLVVTGLHHVALPSPAGGRRGRGRVLGVVGLLGRRATARRCASARRGFRRRTGRRSTCCTPTSRAAPRGHVAIVAPAFDATLARLSARRPRATPHAPLGRAPRLRPLALGPPRRAHGRAAADGLGGSVPALSRARYCVYTYTRLRRFPVASCRMPAASRRRIAP